MLTVTARFPIVLSLSGALHLAAFSIQVPSHTERASVSSPVVLQVRITEPTIGRSTLATATPVAIPASQATAYNAASTSKANASSLAPMSGLRSTLRAQTAQRIFSTRALTVPAADNESAPLPPAAEILPPAAPPHVAINVPGTDAGPGGEARDAAAIVSPSAPMAAIAAPGLVFSMPPRYPDEARWEKRSGKTQLAFRLRPDGTPIAVKLLGSSGHEDLDAAAIEALLGWRFRVSRDVDLSTWYEYAIRFELL